AHRPELVEALLDDAQRQEEVALLEEDPTQPVEVRRLELAVARRGPLGVDEPLALEEADLGDGDVGELPLEPAQHLPHPEMTRRVERRRRRAPRAPSSCDPTTKVRTNRPIWSSPMSCSGACSTRSWSR